MRDTVSVSKIELFEAVSKLLMQNAHNQREFRAIQGYSILHGIFSSVDDYSLPSGKRFLEVNLFHPFVRA